MSEWSGKSKGTPLGYKIFIFILRYLNIYIAYFIAWFVALYFYLFSNKDAISDFYQKVFHFKGNKLRKAVFGNFYMLAKIILDRITLLAGFKGKYTFDFEGEEYLHQLAKEGNGGIILGAHAGNWEIAGKLLSRLDVPVHIIMYDGERSEIKEIIEKTTGGKAFNVVYVKENDMSHIYEINNIIKRGELVAMHGDRFLEGHKAHQCNFFNDKAPFPIGPYYLAASLKVPICFVSTMKESTRHYHFYATEPQHVLNEKTSRKMVHAQVKTMAEKYAANLQGMVKKYPLQWFNYYDFWNTNLQAHE
jgi:predicted LPLAT superfamily acyltransferase